MTRLDLEVLTDELKKEIETIQLTKIKNDSSVYVEGYLDGIERAIEVINDNKEI